MSGELFERVRENGQTAARLVESLGRILDDPRLTNEQADHLLSAVQARKLQIEELIGELRALDGEARLSRLANQITALWDAIAAKIAARTLDRNDNKRAA